MATLEDGCEYNMQGGFDIQINYLLNAGNQLRLTEAVMCYDCDGSVIGKLLFA